MTQCEFIYSNGERCTGECVKNSNFCIKHKYYGKYKYNEPTPEIKETKPISNNDITERPTNNNDFIVDNSYNRWFINECVNKPTPTPTPTNEKSMIAEFMPILLMGLLPVLKQYMGSSNILNMIKNLKGIKEDSKNNLNSSNIKTPDATDVIPIIQTPSAEIQKLPNGDNKSTPTESQG